jgi:hypothetical protein
MVRQQAGQHGACCFPRLVPVGGRLLCYHDVIPPPLNAGSVRKEIHPQGEIDHG